MRVNDFTDSGKVTDFEVVTYNGLEGELVVCVQRAGIVVVRVVVAAHGAPQVLITQPPRARP
jgi:hypothetical protein